MDGTKALHTCMLAVMLGAVCTSPAPAQDAAPLTRIAFGSCAHQTKPQPIWDAVLDYRPELFVFLGDNVYGDVTSAALTELREAYARAATVEGYAKVRATVPVRAMWDDHDYGQNDAGGRISVQGRDQAAVSRFLAGTWGRSAPDAPWHLSRRDLRPRGHAGPGDPARHAQLPLAAAADR